MSLYDLARVNQAVFDILSDESLNHQEAVGEINDLQGRTGFTTSRASVRRARERLGVYSPESTVSGGRVPRESTGSVVSGPGVRDERLAVVIGDYQIGCHDRDFIDRQCEIIRDLKPDLIISTGDELDFTNLGRWVKGLPGEYTGTIQSERDAWIEISKQLTESAPNAEKRMCDSNHIRRLPMAVEKYLPGLVDMPELFVKNFLKLEELGWHFDELPYEVLPGVVYSHGDDWSVTSRGQASKFREVVKTRQANVIFGHSHQASLNTTAMGYGYKMSTHWALNVGHGMQLREAKYIKSTSPDWSRGIGIVHFDGDTAYPELHLELNGKMHVDGRTY